MKYLPLVFTGCALMLAATGNAQVKKKPAPARKPAATKTTVSKTGASSRSVSTAKYTKLAHDLEYRLVKKGTGTVSPVPGDMISLRLKQHIDDSLVVNSDGMNMGKPFEFRMQEPQVQGDLLEGIAIMHEGDSAVFRIPLDSMLNRMQQPRPEWPKKDAKVIWSVKLEKIKAKAVVEAEMKKSQEEAVARKQAQAEADDRLIQAYLQKKGITNAKKTASGLYYVVTQEGTGPMAASGQTATVNYTGINMNGEKFDSNVDPAFNHVEPFKFPLGAHNVIAGWDEGVALMNKGMKATFYIPSGLAYGERARSAQIPANAVLIFDIELVDIQ